MLIITDWLLNFIYPLYLPSLPLLTLKDSGSTLKEPILPSFIPSLSGANASSVFRFPLNCNLNSTTILPFLIIKHKFKHLIHYETVFIAKSSGIVVKDRCSTPLSSPFA